VTSERLYALGVELMDCAAADAKGAGAITRATAFAHRDCLLIAVTAALGFRRRTLAALQIGKQLVRSGNLWAFDIGPENTKNRQALDFPLSAELSARIDAYLDKFRNRIPGATTHTGLWASNKRRAMDDGTIYGYGLPADPQGVRLSGQLASFSPRCNDVLVDPRPQKRARR
jgi:hypothetical protein